MDVLDGLIQVLAADVVDLMQITHIPQSSTSIALLSGGQIGARNQIGWVRNSRMGIGVKSR
jgi:hypothetical protein